MCIRDHFSSLLGPYGTIRHGPFFPDFSGKRGRAQRSSVWTQWSVTRGSASDSGHPKGRVMCTWQSPYEITGDGCDVGGHQYQRGWSLVSPWKEVSVRVNYLHLFVMKYGWVRSMFTIFCLVEGTSTVDIDWFFFGMNPYRLSISTDFWLKSTVDQISTVFSSRWILIDRQYRPYFQVGESLSTVDIDRILR